VNSCTDHIASEIIVLLNSVVYEDYRVCVLFVIFIFEYVYSSLKNKPVFYVIITKVSPRAMFYAL